VTAACLQLLAPRLKNRRNSGPVGMKRSTTTESTKNSAKKRKVSNAITRRTKGKEKETIVWPEYFHDVSRVFLCMNSLSKSLCRKLFKVRQIELIRFFQVSSCYCRSSRRASLSHARLNLHLRITLEALGTEHSSCIRILSQESSHYILRSSFLG
jgi:hypothetical protein